VENCIFCKIINGEIPSYKVYEDDDVLAFLDITQVTPGHTLVISKKHYTNILDIPEDLYLKVQKVVYQLTPQIVTKMDAKGVNILNNNNEMASQSVMHYHTHIIPRYSRDDAIRINFEQTDFNIDDIYAKLKDLNKNNKKETF
jgi:histidine triad (HIT) family protein